MPSSIKKIPFPLILIICILILALNFISQSAKAQLSDKSNLSSNLSLIDQIPDLVQTDPKGNFARGGKSFCGPVAASNSLIWLKAGSKGAFTDTIAQYDVVNQLASVDYMKTDPIKGIGAVGLIRGIRKFVENDIGDKDFTLAYQGWRSKPKKSSTGISTPQLDWICSFVGPGKSAWINLGWYRHDKEKDEYERIGGHWVTLVGYGADEKGETNKQIIVVHDPSPRTGNDPNDYVLLTLLEKGTLSGKSTRLPRPAKGLYLMEGGMHIKSTADVAIIDGVVGLNLNSQTSP